MCFFNGVPVYLCVSVCVASVHRFERIFGHTRSLDKRTVARAPGSNWNLSEKSSNRKLSDKKMGSQTFEGLNQGLFFFKSDAVAFVLKIGSDLRNN